MSHIQNPPAARTVHILSVQNIHYEATNLPDSDYPLISDPSAQQALPTRSRQQQSPSANNPTPPAPNSNTTTEAASNLSLSVSKSTDAPPPRPDIADYCGLVLNKEIYFHAILRGEKIYEVRTISRLILPPRIVLHPNKTVRDHGYTQNIEAMISPFQHEKQIKTAAALLTATNNGKQLGLTEAETRALVTTAKKTKPTQYFICTSSLKPRKPKLSGLTQVCAINPSLQNISIPINLQEIWSISFSGLIHQSQHPQQLHQDQEH
jgi:hypothetical protein